MIYPARYSNVPYKPTLQKTEPQRNRLARIWEGRAPSGKERRSGVPRVPRLARLVPRLRCLALRKKSGAEMAGGDGDGIVVCGA